MRIMQLGAMGRDVAAAEKLADHGHEVYSVAEHRNPRLADISEQSGGMFFCVDDMYDPAGIAGCVEFSNVEMFLTNDDNALAAGVVDEVVARSKSMERTSPLLVPSPDRESARVEWDKFYLRQMVDDIDGQYNPLYKRAATASDVEGSINFFKDQDLPVAVKPRGLTGGKGVKVMGPHLESHNEALEYAQQILKDPKQEGVLLEEVMSGQEFTIQAYSDGNQMVAPPETYDYPYREDGDEGPGTGGMGSFTMQEGERLPFLSDSDYHNALSLMSAVLDKMKSDGNDFKGVLYGSFFMTKEGLKITEFNARGGDPEMMNIINLLGEDVDLADVLTNISEGKLEPDSVRFKKAASAVIYLVSPSYCYDGGDPVEFSLDLSAVSQNDCKAYPVAAEKDETTGLYRTVGSSRTLALAALGKMPWDARSKIHSAIQEGFSGELVYREDVASQEYIKQLAL